MDVLEHLLRAPASGKSLTDLNAWLDRLATCPFAEPIDRALWSGFEADRLGYAFVGGYHAALARLFTWGAEAAAALGVSYTWPSGDVRRSLAATESGGGHPRSIETRLIEEGDRRLVRGTKTFATLATAAEELLIVASRGSGPDGKNRLALVRVRPDAPGITMAERSPTPFAPEIPHARVQLDNVAVGPDDVLPGDGYDVYLKPFRTIEDTHVMGAALGHVIGIARAHGFDRTVVERALALTLSVRAIARAKPSDAIIHIALAGVVDDLRRLLTDHAAEWNKTPSDTRERWERDQPLLLIADAVRRQRTAAAWQVLA
jgi:acyl-CoA dehydrogenase